MFLRREFLVSIAAAVFSAIGPLAATGDSKRGTRRRKWDGETDDEGRREEGERRVGALGPSGTSVPRETERTAMIGVGQRIGSSLASSRNGGFGRAQEILSTLRERQPASSLAFFSLLLLHCGNSKRTVFEISWIIGRLEDDRAPFRVASTVQNDFPIFFFRSITKADLTYRTSN